MSVFFDEVVKPWLDENGDLCEEELFYGDVPDDTGPFDSILYQSRYGGEDCGREFWSVMEFQKDGESCYVKFDGWYASYHGSEYEGFEEVFPKTVTTVVWE